jgi:hypothetical protein
MTAPGQLNRQGGGLLTRGLQVRVLPPEPEFKFIQIKFKLESQPRLPVD